MKHLWEVADETYDVNICQKFNMRVAFMWIANDFPAYGIPSGSSTLGLLGCSICTEKSKAFYLQNDKKVSYVDCHRQFLPRNHQYGRGRLTFIRGRADMSCSSPKLTRDDIWNRVLQYKTAINDPRDKTSQYDNNHK